MDGKEKGWNKIENILAVLLAIIAIITASIAYNTDRAVQDMDRAINDMDRTLGLVANYTSSLKGADLETFQECNVLSQDDIKRLNFSLNGSKYYADIFYVTPKDVAAKNLKMEILIPLTSRGFEYIGTQRTKIFSDGKEEAIPSVDYIPNEYPENIDVSYTWHSDVEQGKVEALFILYDIKNEKLLQKITRSYSYSVQGNIKVNDALTCSKGWTVFNDFKHFKNGVWG